MMAIRVGILDTGIQASDAAESASFLDLEQNTIQAPSETDHGSQLASIIRSYAANAELLDARAFAPGSASSAARIAEAIDWLVSQKANIINMSFGLHSDREVLVQAVIRAQRAGALCVASTPAQGQSVFPANYPAVIAISGDARCNATEFSLLSRGPNWHFGAANGGSAHRAHQRGQGASFACAHATGQLTKLLHSGVTAAELLNSFAEHCCWKDREHRQ